MGVCLLYFCYLKKLFLFLFYEVVADLNKISVNKDDSIIISCFMYDDVDLDYVNKMGIAGKEKAYLRNIIMINALTL